MAARPLDFVDGLEDVGILLQREGNRGLQREALVPRCRRGLLLSDGFADRHAEQRRGDKHRAADAHHWLQKGKIFS